MKLYITGLHLLYMLQWASERGLQRTHEAAYRQGSCGGSSFPSLSWIICKGKEELNSSSLACWIRWQDAFFRDYAKSHKKLSKLYFTGVDMQRQSQEGCHKNYHCLPSCGCRHRLRLHLWIKEKAQWLDCKSPCSDDCDSVMGSEEQS